MSTEKTGILWVPGLHGLLGVREDGATVNLGGVICDNSANRINTHVLGNFGAGKIESLVYGTEAGYASITVPTTFTTGLGPIATLY